MRTFSFVMTRRIAAPFFGCLAIFTMLALVWGPLEPTITEGKNVQVAPEAMLATFFADSSTLGPIPDGPGACTTYGAERDITFNVYGIIGTISDVEVSFTLSPAHTFVGDLDVRLIAPGGAPEHVLFSRTGATIPTSMGSSADAAGPYTFRDSAPAAPTWWTAATFPLILAANYRTSTAGEVAGGGTNTLITPVFAGLTPAQANGTWRLRFRDHCSSAVGTVSSAVLGISRFPTPQKAPFDFDGDGKTDYAVVRNVSGTFNWYVQRSTFGFIGQSFGNANIFDVLVPGDYDGDSRWDIAVWRSGTFYILRSLTGTLQVVPFGLPGDDPRITQDYDGDGKADPSVTRNVGGNLTFYILRSALGFTAVTFGTAATDVGIRGDWDGDGKADVAVYRKNGGIPANTFYVLRSSDGGVQAATFGNFLIDYILPADFDGDGKTDYAVWRFGAGTTGTWYWLQSSDGGFRALNFGIGGTSLVQDIIVPGDYDGDGKTDQAVWRRTAPSTFYVNRSALGFVSFEFGLSNDVPPAFSMQVR